MLGVDHLIVLVFDSHLANMSAQDFVMNVLVGQLHVAHVVVGRDFRFGKGRGGDATVLAYMGEMEGFGVTAYQPVAAEGEEKISSSAIRRSTVRFEPLMSCGRFRVRS